MNSIGSRRVSPTPGSLIKARLEERKSGSVAAEAQKTVLVDVTGFEPRMLMMSDSIRSIVRGGFRADLIRNAASAGGMRRMQEDALEKIHLGVTTIDEIARVVLIESVAPSDCTGCGHELLPAFHFCPTCGVQREESAVTSQPRNFVDKSRGALFS